MHLKSLLRLFDKHVLDISKPLSNGMRVRVKGKVLECRKGIHVVQTEFNTLELSAQTVARYGR